MVAMGWSGVAVEEGFLDDEQVTLSIGDAATFTGEQRPALVGYVTAHNRRHSHPKD